MKANTTTHLAAAAEDQAATMMATMVAARSWGKVKAANGAENFGNAANAAPPMRARHGKFWPRSQFANTGKDGTVQIGSAGSGAAAEQQMSPKAANAANPLTVHGRGNPGPGANRRKSDFPER